MLSRLLLFVLLVAGGVDCSPRRHRVQPPSEASAVVELGWLVGRWVSVGDKGVTEERWRRQAGRLVGRSQTSVGGRVVFNESLLIETRERGVFYVASPDGQATTAFRLTKLSDRTVVFENRAHDYPTSIRYQRDGDTLRARIDGPKRGPKEWTFQRMSDPARAQLVPPAKAR
jgi:hypothetical protein